MVVAIIALLIAILIPSLARARFQAKVVACRANLHDLGTGFFLYTEANRNFYPITPNGIQDTFGALWRARLLKDVKLLICPATKHVIRPQTLNWPTAKWRDDCVEGSPQNIPYLTQGGQDADIEHGASLGRDDARGGHSYEYNGCYAGVIGTNAWSGRHKKSTHWRFFLTQIYLVTDIDDDIPSLGGGKGCEPNNGNNCPQPWDNHGAEGQCMLFADGHSDWVKKFAGTYIVPADPDVPGSTPTTYTSKNATIDRMWYKAELPWYYINYKK